MIRERNHFTVRDSNAWNELLGLISEIDEIQAAAGRVTSTTWTQVVGPYNEIIVELEYPDLATYEREIHAMFGDPQIMKLSRRFNELTVQGKGYNELFMPAQRVGS